MRTCPGCGHELNAAAGLSPEGPRSGDFTICYYCETPMRLTGGDPPLEVVRLEALTTEQLVEFDQMLQIIRVMRLAERSLQN